MAADKALASHFIQDIEQIFSRIETIRLARFDEAVNGGARFGSLRAVTEEPVLPSDGELSAALFVMGMWPSPK